MTHNDYNTGNKDFGKISTAIHPTVKAVDFLTKSS